MIDRCLSVSSGVSATSTPRLHAIVTQLRSLTLEHEYVPPSLFDIYKSPALGRWEEILFDELRRKRELT